MGYYDRMPSTCAYYTEKPMVVYCLFKKRNAEEGECLECTDYIDGTACKYKGERGCPFYIDDKCNAGPSYPINYEYIRFPKLCALDIQDENERIRKKTKPRLEDFL